jgi:hypothetical protein
MPPVFFHLARSLGEQGVSLVCLGLAALMALALLYLSAEHRRSALVRDRSGHSALSFAEYLAACGFDPEIALATYAYLQQVRGVDFPILAKDDLDRDLGLSEEEVTGSLRDLLDETGREYLPGLIDSPMVRVVDLVRWVQASPRRMEAPRRRSA